VIWATGFRRDFGWIRLPILDEGGEPIHHRGVTGCPGLYFLGLPWLHTLKSSVLCAVGRDADHLAECIASQTDAPAHDPTRRPLGPSLSPAVRRT
jgi:putative flavoprotein involved in K+ transport